jgi:flagellar protein FlaG
MVKVNSVDPVQLTKIQEYNQKGTLLEKQEFDPKQKQQARVLNKEEQVTYWDKSSLEELDDAVKKLNSTAAAFNVKLNFSVDDQTERLVVKVMEKESERIIREIPPEYVLNMVAQIQSLIGVFVDARR